MKNLFNKKLIHYLLFTAGFVFLLAALSNFILHQDLFNPNLNSNSNLNSNPNQPSLLINKKRLQEKFAKGLPDWAKTQIAEDLSKYRASENDGKNNIGNKNNIDRKNNMDVENNTDEKNNKNIKIKTTTLESYINKPPFQGLFYFKVRQGKVLVKHQKGLEVLPAFPIIYDMVSFLAKEGYLPDTEFLLGLSDYFKTTIKPTIPIFVFAKDLSNNFEKDLILIPDWMNIKNFTLQGRIKKANHKYPWEKKKSMLFWRGGSISSTGFRQKLVSLSEKYPDLIDAKIVDKQTVKFVAPEEHLAYRYLISVDGVRCSWVRLVWHLASNSLVYKHQSQQVQWFYKGLQPFIHYIPVENEETLLKQIAWAEQNSEKAKAIADSGARFVEENLSLEDMYVYFATLIKEYHKQNITVDR